MDQPAPSRSRRALSFGGVAEDYDRWRPGPVPDVVEWLLPPAAKVAVDLGAGTGALTRLLVERVATVVAVEPDERMRRVLAERVPSAEAVEGRGEAIPLGDGVADAVLASSSWHWMDPSVTVPEIARVLRPGGTLGVVWSGADWTSDWFSALRPRAILERLRSGEHGDDGDDGDHRDDGGQGPVEVQRRRHVLELPDGAPFSTPERTEIRWTLAMTVDDLVGLLGTYSGVITSSPEDREEVLRLARAYLVEDVGLAEGEPTEVPYRAVCWKAVRSEAESGDR